MQLGDRYFLTCCLQEALLHPAVRQTSVILYDTDAPDPWPEALEQFLRVQPSARVVFLSRLADDRMWLDILDSGGYDLLIKPFQALEIRCILRSALTPPVSRAKAA